MDATFDLNPQWLAGFFDGEGSISATSTQRGERTYVKIQVSLSQTGDVEPLFTAIQSEFGGHLYRDEPRSLLSKRLAWRWQTSKQSTIVGFLTAIEPYVYVKRPQVEYTLETIGVPRGRGNGRGPALEFDPGVLSRLNAR